MIKYSPIALFLFLYYTIGNGVVGKGYEVVLSVGSGEVALFETFTLGGAIALPSLSLGFELYDGFVFNLWNVYDYIGPFGSVSLNTGKKGWTLFWDTNRALDGPWGGASTFLSGGFPKLPEPFKRNFTKSNIDYSMRGEPLELDRSALVASIHAIIFATKMVEAIDSKGTNAAMSLGFWLLESTTWANIAIAHRAWNVKEEKYNVDARRDDSIRPNKYRSGPSFLSGPLPLTECGY